MDGLRSPAGDQLLSSFTSSAPIYLRAQLMKRLSGKQSLHWGQLHAHSRHDLEGLFVVLLLPLLCRLLCELAKGCQSKAGTCRAWLLLAFW